jgi:hypothetical protein
MYYNSLCKPLSNPYQDFFKNFFLPVSGSGLPAAKNPHSGTAEARFIVRYCRFFFPSRNRCTGGFARSRAPLAFQLACGPPKPAFAPGQNLFFAPKPIRAPREQPPTVRVDMLGAKNVKIF